MAYDLLIKNAKICDGTGAPAYDGAVAITGGKIAATGKVTETARREINADGLVLAPGFLDIHTHYDAQISWDPLLTSSCWHGVTTVLMGNCGVGVAPCRPAERTVMAWDLVNVEAMPYDVLLNGVSWEWESFPQYMTAIERRGIGLNAGFLVPLSALRFYVMGEAASERAANADEIQQMARIFREAMQAGAYGFSLSLIPRHIGYQGKPLASRLASKDELAALGRVMRELQKGVIEVALVRKAGVLSDEDLDILLHMAQESQRPVTWLALIHMPNMPGTCEQMLARVQPFIEKGLSIPPQVNPRPVTQFYTLRNPFAFSEMPSWKGAFNRTVEEQVVLYRSPQFREAFRDDLAAGRGLLFRGQWDRLHVTRVETEQNKQFLNESIGEIAARLHKDPVDTLLDLAVEERTELGFTVSLINTDPEAVGKLITLPNVLIGLSDAGAHVDQHCEAGVPTYILHEWVHKRQVLTLEEGVRRITSELADFLGLKTKGRVTPGMDADLVLFDPTTVKPHPSEWVNDLPGGKPRLVERSEGIAYTLVNGEILFAHNQYQGGLPGRIVRSTAG
ncbi:MAG TPA: amidohydrolase family protein [Candidatus Binatia bacterium]|nr:amidohydrolase family protein [Candidatus Binatia bacterium]